MTVEPQYRKRTISLLPRTVRAQLVLWNILTLLVLLGVLGLIVHFMVHSIMLHSIDEQMIRRSDHFVHRPPFPDRDHNRFNNRHRRPGPPPGGPPPSPNGPNISGNAKTTNQSAPGPRMSTPPSDNIKTKGQPQPTPPHSAKSPAQNNTVPANGRVNSVAQPITAPNANGTASSNKGQPAQANNGVSNRPETQNNQPEPVLQLFDLKGHSIAWWSKGPPMDMKSYLLSVHGKLVLSTRKVNGFESRILSRPFPDTPPYFGVMQVSYPLTEVNHALEGLDRALLTLIPAAILLASLGGMLLTDRALRPVRRLRISADRISAANFAQRLPVIGQDEFAELARTFNSMLGRLETAYREQEKLVAQLRRFTGDASHELRTPLTIIKANTSLCLSGEPTETDFRQSMEDIDRAADSMSKLVNDLLLLARSDSGQLGVNRIAIPLREAIERAIANVSRKNAATIHKRLPKDGTVVYASEDEIIRLFTNILDNALQHTPPTGSVLITSQRIDGNVKIAIKDTGCGIDAVHLPHLGERFYRIDSARSRPEGGTGLGLSICKSIVDAHGGSISFESEVNVGTTVTITLPVYEDNMNTD